MTCQRGLRGNRVYCCQPLCPQEGEGFCTCQKEHCESTKVVDVTRVHTHTQTNKCHTQNVQNMQYTEYVVAIIPGRTENDVTFVLQIGKDVLLNRKTLNEMRQESN